MSEEKKTSTNNKEFEEGKVCAILAYLLLGVIWYFVDEKMKKNNFTKYHVKQALVLFIVSLVGSLALGVTIFLAWLIPFFQLVIFVLMIIGIMNASGGEKKQLPVIGQFADKLKI